MTKTLKDYFPMIQTREEVLKEIQSNEELLIIYDDMEPHQKRGFLDSCTGVKGVKVTYDGFFKEIFSPEYHPERLEEILELLLGEQVTIQQVLPNDSIRLTDESSLLITDILVELSDGSLANVEIQKIGYAFPGERCACYSSDLLLRQYKRVKSIKGEEFTYRDIKQVYTVVLFEKSTKEFKAFQEYIHHSKQVFDTGLTLNLLQEFVLVPLDIFKKNMQNKVIRNKLDAWLAFLSYDEPEKIFGLLDQYPEFQSMYEEVYEICRNIERVMNMFSKELLELDRNTVQYMIDELIVEAEQSKAEAEQSKAEAEQSKAEAEQSKAEAEQSKAEAEQSKAEAEQSKAEAEQSKAEANQKEIELNQKNDEILRLKKELSFFQKEK